MTAHIAIVIPIKGLRTGKSRLAQVMTDEARCDLNRRLAEHTLRTASAVGGNASVYAVSPDPDIGTLADELSVTFLRQSGDGLNAGLDEAARRLPPGRTIYLAADLPELSQDDIRVLTETAGISIAPDLCGHGTNALSVPSPLALSFRFGPDSFELHSALALESGFPVETINRPGLAFDLDTEDDFQRMKGWQKPTNRRNLEA